MKPRFRPVLERTLEEGINLGYNRAHKHVDRPTEQGLKSAILDAIMLCIEEQFVLDDD